MERLALVLILVMASHTKVPASDFIYPIRPVDFVLCLATLIYLRWSLRRKLQSLAAPEMFIVLTVSVFSALWGIYQLDMVNLDAVLVNGRQLPYYLIAIKKLLLICISFVGFQFVFNSRALSNSQILKYWYRGLWIAVALHALCYMLSTDYLQVRSGVFVEGNHGGSYYLVSFFLMWYALQQGFPFGRSGMVLSLAGIALSQSSAAMVIWLPLTILAFFSFTQQVRNWSLRLHVWVTILTQVLAVAIVFGPNIMLKFTGEELNPTSFSRYDRLSSVSSGVNMFLEHPIFGVGIQGYAFALPQFVDPFIRDFFDWDTRRIANNIYIELLAEQGIIGFVAMLLVILRICKPLFRRYRQHAALALGAISIFLGWLAFPTYTISFHWIGLAILARLAVQGAGGLPYRPRHAATYNTIDDSNKNSPAAHRLTS